MRRNRIIHILIPFALMVVFLAMATGFSYAESVHYATGQINSSNGAYMRKSCSTSAKKVKLLPNDTPLEIKYEVYKSKTSTSAKNKWYCVNAAGKSGYVRSDCVDNVGYTAVSGRVRSKLNYRKGPGTKMKNKGKLSAGTALTVYCKAKPVKSTKGSSTYWYKVQVGDSFAYVASSYVDIVGSIFVNNPSSTPSAPAQTPAATPTYATSEEFEAYLTSQGFPESYKIRLRELHQSHPNWVFIGRNTGISWNSALSKESANGVSLVQSGQPLSYRAVDSNSFTAGTRSMYKTASTSTNIGTVANMTPFTLLDEVWNGTTQWCHIRTSNGTTGYVKGPLYTQSYPASINGTTTGSDLNIRSGAGTSNSSYGGMGKGTAVKVVLQCKDSSGNKWYKIRYGNSYAYLSASYVSLSGSATLSESVTKTTPSANYPTATLSADVGYRAVPDTQYPAAGTLSDGSVLTVTSFVRDAGGNVWYKVYKDGALVFIPSDNVTLSADVAEVSAPTGVTGYTTDSVNYRTGAGTSYSKSGCINAGTELNIVGVAGDASDPWYAVALADGTYYMTAKYINLKYEAAPADADPVVTVETTETASLSDASSLTGTATIMEGTWKAKDGSSWFNANAQTVAYCMDPRNFLNEDRICMFEDLSYQSAYQTTAVVSKILSGTQLPGYGFSAQMFVNAGATYNVSPVFLAARARQETGGGSIAISGYNYSGKVVFNPFNIGAYSGSNPVMNGLQYAYNHGWTSQTAAVNGGASFLASGYINAGQNSIYYQRFNVTNGDAKVGTHQYMTNIQAPYSEAYTTMTSYKSYGITNEALTFSIPIYSGMPDATYLP